MVQIEGNLEDNYTWGVVNGVIVIPCKIVLWRGRGWNQRNLVDDEQFEAYENMKKFRCEIGKTVGK